MSSCAAWTAHLQVTACQAGRVSHNLDAQCNSCKAQWRDIRMTWICEACSPDLSAPAVQSWCMSSRPLSVRRQRWMSCTLPESSPQSGAPPLQCTQSFQFLCLSCDEIVAKVLTGYIHNQPGGVPPQVAPSYYTLQPKDSETMHNAQCPDSCLQAVHGQIALLVLRALLYSGLDFKTSWA